MTSSMKRKDQLLVAGAMLTAAFLMFVLPAVARAAPSERERVLAAIHYASAEQGLDEGKLTRIGNCESGLRENPPGHYKGTFQQEPSYWRGRVASFNDWARSTGRPTMSGSSTVAIDNARLSAWMMKTRGFTRDWPVCGRR